MTFVSKTPEFLDIREAMDVRMVLIILFVFHPKMGKVTRDKSANSTLPIERQTELANLTWKDGMFSSITTNFKALSNETLVRGAVSNPLTKTDILSTTESQYENSSICDFMSTTRYITTDKDESVGMLEYLLQEQVTCLVEYTVHLYTLTGSIFNLEFTYFRTPHCTDQCLCESLTMYDVVNDITQVRDSFCGVRETWSVLSKSNHVILQLTLMNGFESYYTLLDEKIPNFCYGSVLPYNHVTGYVLMYQILPARHYEWISPVKEITNDSGLAYPVFPQIRIRDSLIYKWHIRIRPDKHVIFQYRRFCLEPNLKIYDGPSENPKYTPFSTKKPVDTRIAKGFQIFITYSIKKILLKNNRTCMYVYYQSMIRHSLPCTAQKTFEYFKMYLNRGKPWPTFVALVPPDCALRFHPIFFIIESKSPNHDNCAYRGIAVLNPGSRNGVIFLCNMLERNIFSNYQTEVPHFINMTFILYHYGFDDTNSYCYIDFTRSLMSRGQALLCKPIFTMFDLNHLNIEVRKSYYSNGSTHVYINLKNEPCIYFIFPPQDYYHINQSITFETYGAKKQIFRLYPLHEPKYIKELGCKHKISFTEERYTNRILFNYQINCPFIYKGVLLHLVNKKTCSKAERTTLITLRDSCMFFTADKIHYIKIKARFASSGMVKLSCAKPGCIKDHYTLKYMAPLQHDALRQRYGLDYAAFSQTIIYQLPVVLRPHTINKRWAYTSYFVLLGGMNLVYEPLQQEYMPKETEKLSLQLEDYSRPDFFSTPSKLFYYGHNSTGYDLYKEYGYTEPVSYGGYNYKHCIGDDMDWYEAKSQCERNGMRLLTIDNLWELHFVKEFLQGFWVGEQRRIIPIIHFIGLQVSKCFYPY